MVADKGKKIKLDQKLDVENNPQGKKIKLDQKLDVENKPEELDGELVLSVEKLQEIQDELEKINEEASDKVLEIEQTYNVKRRPVYEKRSEIVKSIPDFWLTAFLSHPVLGDLLTEEDKQIFKYLNSLDVEDFKDVKSGYSITFNFNPNPYFEDTQLTKTFAFQDEGTTAITSTSIKWKEGMGLANGVNNEKKGNKQPLSDESFFQWFKDESEQKAIDPIGDEIAEIIKEDLWPNPLAYFNNDPDEDMDSDEEGGEDDDEDEDEEDN